MKILILMVGLLASINVLANSCRKGIIKVGYTVWNESDYEIWLRFGEAKHGENPDHDLHLPPHSPDPVGGYGCSNGVFTGYETKAALLTRVPGGESNINLAYLNIQNPFSGRGSFSYENQGISAPQCSCQVRVAGFGKQFDWNNNDYFDCSLFEQLVREKNERVRNNVAIVLHCK